MVLHNVKKMESDELNKIQGLLSAMQNVGQTHVLDFYLRKHLSLLNVKAVLLQNTSICYKMSLSSNSRMHGIFGIPSIYYNSYPSKWELDPKESQLLEGKDTLGFNVGAYISLRYACYGISLICRALHDGDEALFRSTIKQARLVVSIIKVP